MARRAIYFCTLSLALGCSSAPWETREFWQLLNQVGGREIDPYAGVCTLMAEELHVSGPIEAREFWVERTYLCPAGI